MKMIVILTLDSIIMSCVQSIKHEINTESAVH